MAAATFDMNQKIISMNLDTMKVQRGMIHHAVDDYVDKVIFAGSQWITRRERNHSTFLEILKFTSKAMAFLSLKCDEIKCELDSETSDLIGRDEFTQQQENAQMDSAGKPATTHGNGKEDDTDDVTKAHTFISSNLESDQQSRYQDVYNQLKSVLAKQDKLEQQLNMKINNLRENTDRLKSDIGTCNQYVETGKALLNDHSQKLESLDQVNKDLSTKVDQIDKDLSARVAQISTDLSDKVNKTNTDLSAKVEQINVVLQFLTNSEKEHAAQMNETFVLKKHFNPIEKDTQNNDKQVQQRLEKVGKNLLGVTQKLTDMPVTVETRCAKKSGRHYSKDELLQLSRSILSLQPPPEWPVIADCCIPGNMVRKYFDPSEFHYHDGSLVANKGPWL